MTYGDLVSRVDFDMRRDSAFSYTCHACNRCCRNKAIRVSPYEILRLARYLDLSTTEFIERNTEAGGTVLRTKENGDCGFLGERGVGCIRIGPWLAGFILWRAGSRPTEWNPSDT